MQTMRKKKNKNEQFQIPIMYAFRSAAEAGDAKKILNERSKGERVISARGSYRRRGADETRLKRNLTIDLMSLVNTIDLDSAVDLEGLDYVKKSVLNFGLYDVAHLTSQEVGVNEIGNDLRNALLSHEPRLSEESLRVEKVKEFDDVRQKVRFTVSAEMYSSPLDIPIEFVAELDVASGKVQLSKLPS